MKWVMKYRIIDMQLNDYVQPYDENEHYWTLEDAADLAYRRWEEVAEREESDSAKDYAYKKMSEMISNPNETQVEMSLEVFDYVLERV